ncbi:MULTISPECIES: hypothetical protein [unclassified Prochlorococcus]|uniref:hypothetical protein n=1 Tax=unclassified Prochlorococcus TaxID=2627481 RepID=UPI000533A16E|nr:MULTISPECIES: hypothetical protein [unclassified Prochlorococcus]KGG16326.1 hypothetical protein EV07_1495 [Prochlorococcus sp. MIT 0603]KGG17940.1 hypothetical protein EV06_0063 [Prochlorococcus sp. MIT 0602]
MTSTSKIYILSQRQVGDIFLDTIVLASIDNIRHDLEFMLIVQPHYYSIARQIQKLLKTNINIITTNDPVEKPVFELSPLERSFFPLIDLIKYKFKYNITFYRYWRPLRTKAPINLKFVYLAVQYIFLSLIGSRKLKANSSDTKFFLNESKKSTHVLDILISTSSNYFRIDPQLIRDNIIFNVHNSYLARSKDKAYNDILVLPSVGVASKTGPNKEIPQSIIDEIITLNSSNNRIMVSYYESDKRIDSYANHYASLTDLVNLITSSNHIIASDSFPAHLTVYLGSRITIFLPGSHYGLFHPYPKWFPKNSLTEYIIDRDNIKNFNCCGNCIKCLETMHWDRIHKNFI